MMVHNHLKFQFQGISSDLFSTRHTHGAYTDIQEKEQIFYVDYELNMSTFKEANLAEAGLPRLRSLSKTTNIKSELQT